MFDLKLLVNRRAIERVINASDVSDVAFSHVKVYAAWETDEIIGKKKKDFEKNLEFHGLYRLAERRK